MEKREENKERSSSSSFCYSQIPVQCHQCKEGVKKKSLKVPITQDTEFCGIYRRMCWFIHINRITLIRFDGRLCTQSANLITQYACDGKHLCVGNIIIGDQMTKNTKIRHTNRTIVLRLLYGDTQTNRISTHEKLAAFDSVDGR